MSTSVTERPPRPPEAPRPRQLWLKFLIATAGAAVVAVLVLMGALVLGHVVNNRPIPKFPSLAASPDQRLTGTVAYVSDNCVRIVAASGQPSKQVLCLPALDPVDAQKYGKPIGPQLVWRPDGRLEITMFRMKPSANKGQPPPPGFNAGWQKVVDVRTGAVEDMPAARVPTTPNLSTQPTVNAAGQRLAWTSNESSGRVTVTLTDANGTRTLLSAQGPGEYTYRLSDVFWSPDGSWVAAYDRRILVITPTTPPVTRVLVDAEGGSGEFPTFAVTSANLISR